MPFDIRTDCRRGRGYRRVHYSFVAGYYLAPSGISVVSAVFLAIGFGIPFAIWFGGWAFVIAYIGNFVGAGLLAGLPLITAIPFGTVDLIQLGLPMLLYRLLAKRFGVSPIGKDVFTIRGFLFFLFCAVLPNNIIGGLYGNLILIWSGINPLNVLLPGWVAWVASNVVVTIVIGSVLLRTLGPVVERFGLTVRNAFSYDYADERNNLPLLKGKLFRSSA